jgi:hypothetical protein
VNVGQLELGLADVVVRRRLVGGWVGG